MILMYYLNKFGNFIVFISIIFEERGFPLFFYKFYSLDFNTFVS